MTIQAPSGPRHRGADGAVLRPAAVSDTEAVLAMLARCSRATLFHRFHGFTDGVPYFRAQLRDRPGDETLLAWYGSTCVGAATLGVGHTVNEKQGVLVEDAWQRQGAGTASAWHIATGDRPPSKGGGADRAAPLLAHPRPKRHHPQHACSD